MLDNFYAKENNIKVGDTILVKYETLELKEKVLGLINVPDHLYDTEDASQLYPDRKEFGFAYISINEITEDYIKRLIMKEQKVPNEDAFSMIFPNFNYQEYIPYNNIMVDVDEKEKKESVKNEIEEKIENAKAIIKVEDTASYVTYQGEIDEGKTYVGVFSGIFLLIAMLSTITTMTRVVKNQRTQIGTLKAIGFTNHKILFHYIGYGLWVSIIASITGLILGYFVIGNIFMNLQMSFFEIPNGHPVMANKSYLVALLTILTVAIITLPTTV